MCNQHPQQLFFMSWSDTDKSTRNVLSEASAEKHTHKKSDQLRLVTVVVVIFVWQFQRTVHNGLSRLSEPVGYSEKHPEKNFESSWSTMIRHNRSCELSLKSVHCVTVFSMDSSWSTMISYSRSCDFSLKSLHCVRVFFNGRATLVCYGWVNP